MNYKYLKKKTVSGCSDINIKYMINTVKTEMFADKMFCVFAILYIFAIFNFANLVHCETPTYYIWKSVHFHTVVMIFDFSKLLFCLIKQYYRLFLLIHKYTLNPLKPL